MNPSAWLMLGLTWTVILVITGYLFLKVMRTPPRDDDGE